MYGKVTLISFRLMVYTCYFDLQELTGGRDVIHKMTTGCRYDFAMDDYDNGIISDNKGMLKGLVVQLL